MTPEKVFDEATQTLKSDITVEVVDDGVVIDETNFDQYFFDVRKHRPQPGQVMARYTAMAEFVDGDMKRDVVYLLQQHNKGGESAQKVMRKLAGATEGESIRLLMAMTEDLLSGMSVDEVCEKPYPYQCEFFYYTERKNVPTDDPHWSVITVRTLKPQNEGEAAENDQPPLNS